MCDFKKFAPKINCNVFSSHLTGIFKLKDCNKDPRTHLKSLNLLSLNSVVYPSECQLILNRAGLPDIENLYSFSISAHHRNELGLRYETKRKYESLDHQNEIFSKY